MPLTHSTLSEIRDKLDLIPGTHFIALAGGAPRDMYLGREPRDYDFYSLLDYTDDQFESLGFTVYGEGSLMPINGFYRQSIALGYGDIQVNLILLDEPLTPLDLIETFDCSLSKFYYDFYQQKPTPNRAAKLSMATKTVTFSPDVTTPYRNKICRYFHDYPVRTELELVYDLIENKLREAPESLHPTAEDIQLQEAIARIQRYYASTPPSPSPDSTILRQSVHGVGDVFEISPEYASEAYYPYLFSSEQDGITTMRTLNP